MKALYTQEEFNSAKGKDLLPCECIICKKTYHKQKRVIDRTKYPNYNWEGYCSPKCQGVKFKKIKIFIPGNCEYCQKEHDGSFGSGRFCSRSCSNGFSTKEKRKEINKKISKNFPESKELTCLYCGLNKKIPYKSKRKFCSNKCSSDHTWSDPEFRKKMSKKLSIALKGKSGGLREGGGRTKLFEYNSHIAGKMKINRDEIKVAECLDLLNVKWKRNWKGFPYITKEGESRKYYPDFFIEDYDLYVEYKGWVIDEMIHKMKDAKERNKFNLKIIYSPKFSYLGLSLEDVQKNPKLILKNREAKLEKRSGKK